MKHIVRLILFLLITITITGCYGNPGASYGSLIQIVFLDGDGNELDSAAYPNQSCTYEEEEATTLSDELVPLNSPAPGNYYFCVSIPKDIEITVRFILRHGKLYHFYSIDLGESTITAEDVAVSENGVLYHVDYTMSSDRIQEGFLSVSNLKMATDLEDDTSIKNGTVKPHANNSIKGIVIRFIMEEQVFSKWKRTGL